MFPTDVMVDPEHERSLDARRAAWEGGFDHAANAVERGERDLASFPASIRSGVERALQDRREALADEADAAAFGLLIGS